MSRKMRLPLRRPVRQPRTNILQLVIVSPMTQMGRNVLLNLPRTSALKR